ncbi:MAG: metalloregulator ArsR/SmtB family transcription factor [Tetrasphaera sp.]
MPTPSDDRNSDDSPAPALDDLESTAELHALGPAACLFKSLGDETRLTILQHLSLGEHRVVDLTDHLGLAQSTVSAHLACLRDCGLVVSRPKGRASMWSLAVPELLALLRSAELLLEATGDSVTLCPTHESTIAGATSPHADREERG